ncbi:hypothetical protein AK812_SmicGene45128, partial [Symbiodinium microadriaticum]
MGKRRGNVADAKPPQDDGAGSAMWMYGAFTCFGVVMALAVQFYSGVSKQQSFHRLIEWVRQNDGFVSGKIAYIDGTGKGAMLQTSAPVYAGESLMKIPHKLHISDANIRRGHAGSRLPAHVDSIVDLSLGRSGVAAMAAWLTSQHGSYLSKPASTGFWQPWWDMFTPPYSMPFYRQETELLLLFGSYEFQELGRMLFWYQHDFEKLQQQPCSSKAAGCIRELQLMDFDMYQAMNQFILSHGCKGPGDKPHIIPVFEFLNHSPELASDLNYQLDQEGNLVLWAKWDIPAGTEITNSYGRRSNPELLQSYGFADPPFAEPFWSVRIFTQVLAEKYFPDLDFSEMEIDVRLATPWLENLPAANSLDSAEIALTSLQNELSRAKGTAPSILGLVETVAEHFLSWYRSDQLLQPYRQMLEENRLGNATSSVWWTADEGRADVSRERFASQVQAEGDRSKREVLWTQARDADHTDP